MIDFNNYQVVEHLTLSFHFTCTDKQLQEVCSVWDGILSSHTYPLNKQKKNFGLWWITHVNIKVNFCISNFGEIIAILSNDIDCHSQYETSWGPLHPEIPGLSGGWNCMCLVFPRVEHSVSQVSLYWICHKTILWHPCVRSNSSPW